MKAILIGLVILAVGAIMVVAQGRREPTGAAVQSAPESAAAGTAAVDPVGDDGDEGDGATEGFASRTLTWEELAAIIAEGDSDTYLVDVRTPEEFNAGAIPGAINIPHTQIGSGPPTGNRSDRIIVYCRSGNRSGAAKYVLEQLGYTNVNDFGGVYRWKGDLVQRQ